MFDVEGHANSRLGGPGMEYLIEEQMEAEKRIPKNVKFNKAFDISKVWKILQIKNYWKSGAENQKFKVLNVHVSHLSHVSDPWDMLNNFCFHV